MLNKSGRLLFARFGKRIMTACLPAGLANDRHNVFTQLQSELLLLIAKVVVLSFEHHNKTPSTNTEYIRGIIF